MATGLMLAATGGNRSSDEDADTTAIDTGSQTSDGTALTLAANRAVVLRTTSCGDTSRAFGSGIRFGPREVLTAAHVVAGAGTVSVEVGSWSTEGTVQSIDWQRDLALVVIEEMLPRPIQSPTNFGLLDVGEQGWVVGAASSGTIPFAVLDRTIIETDDVRSPTRSRRAGYVIDASTQRGDSGAGIYSSEGKLVGMVFAASTASEGRSFVTSSSEISDFVSETKTGTEFRCDPTESKLAPVS